MRVGRSGEALIRRGIRAAGYENLRKLFMLWLDEIVRGRPDEALRRLLRLDEDLGGQLDKASIRYDGGVHAKHRLMRYHDFFVERVREGERVLDVGCGKGELAYDLAERAGASVVAVDLEERPLAFARERFAHLRIEYRLADATSFGPEERFDVAVLSNVLEHVDDRVQLLRRLSRVAPRFLFRVPMWNREWTVPLRRELGLTHLGPGHFVEYDEPAFRAELAEAGLRVTHSQVNWGELWAEATVDEPHSPSETQPR